jgi:Zn-dependent protease
MPLSIFSIIFVLVALTIHEFAHAWAANYLGDPTARLEGRMTLNPIAHLDPLGTLTLLLFGFGWGKPVPVDAYNLRNPRRDEALISLAGPGSNLVFTLLIAGINLVFPIPTYILRPLMTINLGLGLFNLIPLHPLDGSKILIGLLPFETAQEVEDILSQFSIPLLITLFLPIFNGRSVLDIFLIPSINFILRILI